MEFFRGLRLLAAHPRLWSHSIPPILLALAVYAALGAGAWLLLAPRAARWATDYGMSGWIGEVAATVLLVVAWVFLFSTLFIALAGVFGSFLWDRLAADVEAIDGRSEPPVRLGPLAVAADSVARLLLAIVVAAAALIGAILLSPLAPVIGWAAAGFLGLLDYSAPAALRRGWTLPRQMGRVLCRKSFSFAAIIGVVSLLPLVNLLLWPASVAGGTLLVLRLESENPT